MDRGITDPSQHSDDNFETTLRPRYLSEFIGQDREKNNLAVYVEAAKKRGEAIDHILFHGPPGLGKTTLASIIANELGVGFKAISAPSLEKPGDLAAILTGLEKYDVLFIDEIHRLKNNIEEMLYSAMEDYYMDIIVGQGVSASTIRINLEPFTLIGATTRAGLLTAPLLERFGILIRLDYYSVEDLVLIAKRSAKILGIGISEKGAYEIAKRSRGTPRITNRIIRRLRDFAQVVGNGIIDDKIAIEGFKRLNIDECGLDEMDRKIVLTLIDKFGGGPVGIETIAISVGEEIDTITDVYEPYLIQTGLLKRTQRGRMATQKAYNYFKKYVQKKHLLFN